MSEEVRVRFAPSPTGPLHIGGVRTALYNYLFAKRYNGKMVLRIEDTDQARYIPGAEEYILEALDWCGIKLDESPHLGGPYQSYKQSERKSIYGEYIQKLLDEDKAYYAFDTSEELAQMRERLKAARVASPQYNAITRDQMKNSLTLPQDEVKARLDAGEPYVVRLKVPRKEEVRLNDMIRGWVMVHSSAIDDKVLMKSDGMPTYHLANVVDDHLMRITHVIRGEEWLPSAPLHVLLYKYLGWEDSMPQFAHLPLILKPDGNGKLSKRDGDKLGFPVFPLEWRDPESGEYSFGFREEGYLPEALINFLAFLGWNPGTSQEMFTLKELEGAFSVERIGKAGTKFDIHKIIWFNQQYLKEKSGEELAPSLIKDLEAHQVDYTQEQAVQVCNMLKERVSFPSEFWKDGQYFFLPPKAYDEKVARKKWKGEAITALKAYAEALEKENEGIDAERAKIVLTSVLESLGIPMGKIMQALRLSVAGVGSGPDLMEILAFLGKEEVVNRINTALEVLGTEVE